MITFLLSILTDLLACLSATHIIHIYADLPGFKASKGPQAMVPSDLLIAPYRPDIVVHNSEASSIA